MKLELYKFQKNAVSNLREMAFLAMNGYRGSHRNQVISFTAPTGAGKTIIMASLIEEIFCGDANYEAHPEAIFLWLSDSPQLNEQSKNKIDLKSDRILLGQCVTISEESFDQEILDDGHIYFLNTQKLGKSSNLTKRGDSRQYTIWETLANTAEEKSDRLYVIIDEAHRGMLGQRDILKATTIMQKFLKGSPEDEIKPMPVVIGMSATIERFNSLISGIQAITYPVPITADEVRESGLLKDRIIIYYPDENTADRDMAILQAATDEWKDKCDHWDQYCFEQHYAYVNPVFVVQVLNSTSANNVSGTDLNECLRKIEERYGNHFKKGEVVHTFGQTKSELIVNGLEVPYVEPSAISENRSIKIVFFKENLSTGWDCPRAETMMSFRHAIDATYIAQLLGRMIRTPLHCHVDVDETLNDVHLYLPYFDAATVEDVVHALQAAEGGNIASDIYGQSIDAETISTMTVRPRAAVTPGIYNTPIVKASPTASDVQHHEGSVSNAKIEGQMKDASSDIAKNTENQIENRKVQEQENSSMDNVSSNINEGPTESQSNENEYDSGAVSKQGDLYSFDREEVRRAINNSGLLTYDVRRVRINGNYLKSLYDLARLLYKTRLWIDAKDNVLEEIVDRIHKYADGLRATGKYDEMAKHITEFELKKQVVDAYGESIDEDITYSFMSTTDADIERQFVRAEIRLGNEGVAQKYGRHYYDQENPNAFKIDVILYANDDQCRERLMDYAEKTYHAWSDRYRRETNKVEERYRKEFNDIFSDADEVSSHSFCLPENYKGSLEDREGKTYTDHLYVDDKTGVARIKLNDWEEGVLLEEQRQPDYECWLRNPSRKPWALCIPYKKDGKDTPTYPDFLIIRKDANGEYVVDVLEPHDPTRTDNLGKAQGFAEYAKNNPGLGRIELIRKGKNGAGRDCFMRLDMARSEVRKKVLAARTDDELSHIFEADGYYMK